MQSKCLSMPLMKTCLIFALLILPIAKAQASISAEAKPESSPEDKLFAPYLNCKFPDGLSVVETAPLANGIQERTMKTILGSEQIPMTAGRRIMFAYPAEDFYANVKVEVLPANDFAQSRKKLIANFDYILASGDNSRNYTLQPRLNGFEIQGLDRSKREGGVLGIYLFFDDQTHTVTTIYFLNQEPPTRFQTMEQYAGLRDGFLETYTHQIRSNLSPIPAPSR